MSSETKVEVAPHPSEKFYEVPSYNMEGLRKRMAALAKRAAKLGCESPGFIEHAAVDKPEYVKDPMFYHIDGSMIASGKIERSYILEVTGEAPAYAGWTFLASVDVMPEAGNLVRVVPGQVLPEKYRTEAPHCDHCGHKRNRINHYIVRSDKGEFKMVGSGCIRDFLGHNSPDNILAMASLWASLDGVMRESSGGGGGSGTPDYLDLLQYLSYVAAVISKDGWLSAGRAYEEQRSGQATKNIALTAMFWRATRTEFTNPYKYTDDDALLASRAIAWAQNIEIKSDFDHNLHTLAQSEVLPYKGAGIAAAMIYCYKRNVEQEMLREKKVKQFANSVHVGEIGKRQEFTVTVLAVYETEGQWGKTSIYKMTDAAGNCLTWFSSNHDLEIGTTYTLKGSVKAHDEYKGTKQTVITRCKIVNTKAVEEVK